MNNDFYVCALIALLLERGFISHGKIQIMKEHLEAMYSGCTVNEVISLIESRSY